MFVLSSSLRIPDPISSRAPDPSLLGTPSPLSPRDPYTSYQPAQGQMDWLELSQVSSSCEERETTTEALLDPRLEEEGPQGPGQSSQRGWQNREGDHICWVWVPLSWWKDPGHILEGLFDKHRVRLQAILKFSPSPLWPGNTLPKAVSLRSSTIYVYSQ